MPELNVEEVEEMTAIASMAAVLDHPSVYTGGPSLQSIRRATDILGLFRAEGWTLVRLPKQPGDAEVGE